MKSDLYAVHNLPRNQLLQLHLRPHTTTAHTRVSEYLPTSHYRTAIPLSKPGCLTSSIHRPPIAHGWQLGSHHYTFVYSAYKENAQVIIVGMATVNSVAISRLCYFWYETRKYPEVVSAKPELIPEMHDKT